MIKTLGFLPKAVIRQEIVPMLHKCVSMNPYMPIMNQVLRPSSKNFVRTQVGGYGRKIGMEQKKEFGEGDEGFMEEVATPPDSGGPDLGSSSPAAGSSSPFQSSWNRAGTTTPSTAQNTFRSRRPQQQQLQSQVNTEDPIEDFSD